MKRLKVGVVGLGLGMIHVAPYSKQESVGRLVVSDANGKRCEEVLRGFASVC